MGSPRFSSVEAYLEAQDATKQQTLRKVIDFILAQNPQLECKLAWNVPQIHLHGQYVASICAYKNHLTFAPWSAQVMENFAERLKSFVVFKNCFQLPIDWEIDKNLLCDLVEARLAELR